MQKLKNWMITATAEELQELATKAGTSVKHLHHLVLEYRFPSADLAGRIADTAEKIRLRRVRKEVTAMPVLTRADLCEACANCPYAKACLKSSTTKKRA